CRGSWSCRSHPCRRWFAVKRWSTRTARKENGASPTAAWNASTADLLPGEDRLLEFVDRIGPAFQAQPAQLQQHRTGRRVNEVVAQRHLHDGTGTLGDGDEAGRILPQELVQ